MVSEKPVSHHQKPTRIFESRSSPLYLLTIFRTPNSDLVLSSQHRTPIRSMAHTTLRHTGFLDLPAEIRIAIYGMVALQRTRPAGQRSSFPWSGSSFQISRFTKSGPPVFYCNRSQCSSTRFPTVFKDLRLCSHQIYAETKQYLCTIPSIDLTILDNRLLTYCSSRKTLDLLGQLKWIQTHVRSVTLRITPFGLDNDRLARERARSSPESCSESETETIFRSAWYKFASWQEGGGNMKLLAQWLMSLPNLRRVVVDIRTPISMPYHKFFGNWADPLGDAEALYPLKERGVLVGIRAQCYTHPDPNTCAESRKNYKAAFKMIKRKKFWRRLRGMKTDDRATWDFI